MKFIKILKSEYMHKLFFEIFEFKVSID